MTFKKRNKTLLFRTFNIEFPQELIPLYDFLQNELYKILNNPIYYSKLNNLNIIDEENGKFEAQGKSWTKIEAILYGVIEQDNFYPKYLFKQNFEVSTYGVLDKDIEFYDLSDEDFEINNKFEKEIFDYIISILEESLIRSDFQLVDKIHECPVWRDIYFNKGNTILEEDLDKFYRRSKK